MTVCVTILVVRKKMNTFKQILSNVGVFTVLSQKHVVDNTRKYEYTSSMCCILLYNGIRRPELTMPVPVRQTTAVL